LEAGPTLASSQRGKKCYGLQLVHRSQWTKISAIKDHEICNFHLKIAPRYTTPVEELPAAQCIKLLNQNEIDKLSIKFRNAHYVAKHNKHIY
jgi:hypothetical protein